MANHDFESNSFDSAEQAEIVRRAARLQAEHLDRLSGNQIERIAEEAGIDSHFVRIAAEEIIGQRNKVNKKERVPPAELSTRAVAAFSFSFLVIQGLSVFNLMHVFAPGVGGSPFTGFAIVMALMLGVALSRVRRGPIFVLQVVLGSSLFLCILMGLYTRGVFGQVESTWWPGIPTMLLAQAGVALVGYWLGRKASDPGTKHGRLNATQ